MVNMQKYWIIEWFSNFLRFEWCHFVFDFAQPANNEQRENEIDCTSCHWTVTNDRIWIIEAIRSERLRLENGLVAFEMM